jgi:all-trans-8'-apo-beta-carotenal 15,15'-oxygenase
VIPLDAPASPIRFRMPAFWTWHIANAFQSGDELIVDMTHYESFPSSAKWLANMTKGDPGGPTDGVLRRLHIDPARGYGRWEPIASRTGEFPRIAPQVEGQRHRMAYNLEHSTPEAGASGIPDVLVSRDMNAGTLREHPFAPYEWPSEAVFVPRGAGEDEGALISLVYDAKRHESAWMLFDAAHPDEGPFAKVWHGQHVPLGFHGAWRPST